MGEIRLRELAKALCDKLRIVHASEEYKGIWSFAHTHGISYDGPTYVGELSALEQYLHGEGKEPEKLKLSTEESAQIERQIGAQKAMDRLKEPAKPDAWDDYYYGPKQQPPTDANENFRQRFPMVEDFEVHSNHKPPTDKWEEWVQRMPSYGDYDSRIEWEAEMRQWFREMPR